MILARNTGQPDGARMAYNKPLQQKTVTSTLPSDAPEKHDLEAG